MPDAPARNSAFLPSSATFPPLLTGLRPALLRALLPALVAAASACARDEGGPDEADATPARRFEVKASSYAYAPARFESPAGTIRFVVRNAADEVHGFEVEGHGVEEEIARIDPGATDSLTVTLTEPGTYEIYCPVADHESRGMTGALTVSGGA